MAVEDDREESSRVMTIIDDDREVHLQEHGENPINS